MNGSNSAFMIGEGFTTLEPYSLPFKTRLIQNEEQNYKIYSATASQEGLAVKTYQSDMFNNWVNTEWLEGAGGVNDVTKIDTSKGYITIDEINLSNKVYNMLNRVAISDGTYDSWLEVTYDHIRQRSITNPWYAGGLSKEIVFQEVISNAAAEGQPLGTLAGRGRLSDKHKGGYVTVKIDEPSYIMGIVSITPRIDYSQGNKWDVNLENMDQLHKPALDAIGFQDRLTDEMAWFDTIIQYNDGNPKPPTFKSIGKQPAWLHYMTNVNQVRGNFADANQQMFMVLNREYSYKFDGLDSGVKDLTTYIDPVKYNHIFADTRRDAQNFWVQIGADITARRKMSARIMPNL